MPMIRSLYPSNWEEIALQIKNESNWKCDQCGRECRRPGQKFLEFIFPYLETGRCCQDDLNHPQRFTLTVAHLNHRPGDCRRENLKALCSSCHCRYDSKYRALKRHLKLERNGQLSLWDMGYLELIQLARGGVTVHSLLNISIPEDPIKEFLAGNITEGCLMEYLGVDRLEARRLVQEYEDLQLREIEACSRL